MSIFGRNKKEEVQQETRPEDIPVGIFVKDFSMIRGKSSMATVVSTLYYQVANYAQTWKFKIVKVSDPEEMRLDQMQITAIFEKLADGRENDIPSNNPEI